LDAFDDGGAVRSQCTDRHVMMCSMRFAINLMNFGYLSEVNDLVELAVEAEDAGWDAVFLADHVNWADMGFHVDPWVALGLIADRTSTVLIGTSVTPLPRRRPTKLAREILTLHQISEGRFVFGAGSGLWRSEFADLGDVGDFATRGEMLDEGLDLLQKTWSGDAFDHEGAHYRAKGQTFAPGGAEIPIWVAGSWPNRKPFRRAARFDGVMAVSQEFTRPLSPNEVSAILTYVAEHRDSTRSFNLAIAMNTSDDASADAERAAAYAAAGADWWQEGVIPVATTLHETRATIRRGPPHF
jgi:alkanesulfonate monooxygenase SsuD/methylene tetrahydromethanopterin reductase-like flavin-dependent oxidoreductase (luciferase family)